MDKIWYDSNPRVAIENAFGSLKNRWHILKHLNSRDDRTSRVVATCVLHNYCMDWGAPKPRPPNAITFKGFKNSLLTF